MAVESEIGRQTPEKTQRVKKPKLALIEFAILAIKQGNNKDLTEEEKRVLGLFLGENQTTRQVANELNLRPDQVRIIGYEALTRLARNLGGEGAKTISDLYVSVMISEALKGKRRSPETRQKMSEAHKKKWQDPHYRQRLSEALKKNWQDPQYRQRMSEARKKKWQDPQYRQRMLEIRHRRSLST